MGNSRIATISVCLVILSLVPLTLFGSEPVLLPRKNDAPSTITKALMENLPPGTVSLEEKPKLLNEILVFKIGLEKQYPFGVEWDKNRLEKILGKPLRGQYLPSLKDGNMIDVENLFIKDLGKIVDYFTRFGDTKLLYSQTWSQALGEQITREYHTVLPYITTFGGTGSGSSPAKPYAQSSVKVGMTVNFTISGLQISGDEPSADITFEIDLKDAYKTKDDLFAINNIISVDSTTLPLDHTLIQTNIFHQENVRNEYIFLITSRKMR